MTTAAVVEVTNLTYSYGARGQFPAVHQLDLAVQPGELYALLGTNGAGKTTSLEAIEGHRRPTSGSVRVFGDDPYDRRAVRPRVGIMLQEVGFAPDLTVAESVRLAGAISGRDDRVDRVVSLVGLDAKSETRVVQLSGGERRRLDFAMAVWGDPALLFLDEPTTGLDPAARDALWNVIAGLRERGTTIILTTHYLEAAQKHADRIGLMHRGRLEREGTLEQLVDDQPAEIRFVAPPGIDLPLAVQATEHGTSIVKTDDLQRDLTLLLTWADRGNHRLAELSAAHSSLDDLFRTLTNGDPS